MNCTKIWAYLFVAAVAFGQETADLNVVHRIRAEAFKKGKVGQHLQTLSDRYGPRLTASPEYDAAAEWVLGQMREWGMTNVHLEKWGPFGRSWSLKRFSIHMTEPQYAPLIAFPLAWSDSTNGPVQADALLLPVRDTDMEKFRADIDRFRKEQTGKLRGKVVMITPLKQLALQLQPAAKRYTDAELAQRAVAPEPIESRTFDYSRLAVPEDPEERTAFMREAPPAFREALSEKRKELRRELHAFLRSEGAAAVFSADRRGDGGTVFGESAGWWEAKFPSPLPVIALTPEHYNRIARLLNRKTPVKVEFEVRADISKEDVQPANVVAEIPGVAKPNELVIVGAHLDSWIGGTGATDNASGCSVAIEAMRILKALNLRLDRTVRMVLWSGEEQGLFGSKAYVKQHYGDPKTMQLKSGHENVSAYFNLDNGSGKIRGVYLQGNDAARPVFERWLAPFRDMGVTTLSIRDTFGTDHLSFDAVGIPGFQFIQDPLEYSSRTHHSNMDVLDHVQTPDMMQASAVMASVIYHAANRADRMPRKPLPDPEPKWAPAPEGKPGSVD
jgi:carboxypeptidase Q